MPASPPPTGPVLPRHFLLPSGTMVWRVHEDRWSSDAFNPSRADPHFGGSRFDSTPDDPYDFLYLAGSEEAALSEVLARDLWPNSDGDRLLAYASVAGRCLSALVTTRELRLVSLRSTLDLAAVGQDEWLVNTDPSHYGQTRAWARWLRQASDTAQGLAWQSNRHRPTSAFVLFGDRCLAGTLAVLHSHTRPLYSPDGIEWLNDRLRAYRMRVEPPR
ncbi:RES family NAD+ phosphorylase [Catellatospora sp. KI3]|uniref:RES family NAD+ phosphorylase n=1 Tax=Catellatospora sp. KI3 TaxID=3041620 RepID=UPI002482E176|nr:RES family NAD+ phosphorylase [Catellatospora sp. KI3]MDI1462843.1 RES family NAD+ phosphorylase [Catellatospora sp. KI3]